MCGVWGEPRERCYREGHNPGSNCFKLGVCTSRSRCVGHRESPRRVTALEGPRANPVPACFRDSFCCHWCQWSSQAPTTPLWLWQHLVGAAPRGSAVTAPQDPWCVQHSTVTDPKRATACQRVLPGGGGVAFARGCADALQFEPMHWPLGVSGLAADATAILDWGLYMVFISLMCYLCITVCRR